MKVVGLTGGIATGKSTVGRILSDVFLVSVIDADVVARKVVEPGTAVLEALVGLFGLEILQADGYLDRRAMRRRISRDEEARRVLNQLIHPAIRSAISEQLAALAKAGAPVAVVEAALLVETASYRLYDALIVASCKERDQLRRLMRRDGVTEGDARNIIGTQLPLKDKEALATVVIRTDGPLDQLQEFVLQGWQETLRRLGLNP